MRIVLFLLCVCLAGAALAQPEMDLLRNSVSIADGGTDDISNPGYAPFNLTYTIANDGTSVLNLTSMPEVAISNETNCSVTVLSAPSVSIASGGGTTTFTLQVSPTSATGFSFDLSIDNNDTDENPYNITFNGGPSTSSGSGGGGGKGGCSTDDSQGLHLLCWLVLLALLVPARVLSHKLSTRRDLRRAYD